MDAQERILGVAMMVKNKNTDDRFIVTLPPPNRHHHLLRLRAGYKEALPYLDIRPLDDGSRDGVFPTIAYHERYQEYQGFTTSARAFITREEALKVATASNQLLAPVNGSKLYSEDLW